MSNNSKELNEKEMKEIYVCVCGYEGKGYEVAQHFMRRHNDLYKELDKVESERLKREEVNK